MPTTELQQMIDVVAKDKGIDPTIVISAIEDAYLAASRKVFKTEEDLRTRFNLETGQVELYAVKLIVTLRACDIVTLQVPVPLQAPDQPLNVEPPEGVAVSVTSVLNG